MRALVSFSNLNPSCVHSRDERNISTTFRMLGGLPLYRDISVYILPARSMNNIDVISVMVREASAPIMDTCPNITLLGVTRIEVKGK